MAEPALAVVLQRACGESSKVPAEDQLVRWALAALGGQAAGEVTVRVVDAAESQMLNRRYRDKDCPTNVLAFPADPVPAPLGENELLPLGDLVICAAVVEAEAAAQQVSVEAHWAHMVVHGCLHLLGWDHQTADQAAAMEAVESRMLLGLGFADPYLQ